MYEREVRLLSTERGGLCGEASMAEIGLYDRQARVLDADRKGLCPSHLVVRELTVAVGCWKRKEVETGALSDRQTHLVLLVERQAHLMGRGRKACLTR